MNKNDHNTVIIEPEFPRTEKNGGIGALFAFIGGTIVWLLLLIVFLVSLYAQLFGRNLAYLLSLANLRPGRIPFWFSLLMTVFFFPITLVVVLSGALVGIIRGKAD